MKFKPGDIVVPNQNSKHARQLSPYKPFYGCDAWDSRGNLVWFAAGDFGFVIERIDSMVFKTLVRVLDVCVGQEIEVFESDLILAEIQ